MANLHPNRYPLEIWRYIEGGKTVHYLGSEVHIESICGIWQPGSHVWRGTGNQEEYEIADSLPECKNCLSRLKRE